MMQFKWFTKRGFSLQALIASGFTLLFALLFIVVETYFPPDECDTFFSCPTLTIPMLMSWASSVCSFILVTIGCLKHRVISPLTILLFLIQGFITIIGIIVFGPIPLE